MNKVWFITGAGSGLGAGIAQAALRAGDRVVATGRHLEKVRNAFPGVITPVIEERLREARANETLSRSTAGSF